MTKNKYTETYSNAILRRADWRFLLSNAKPKKSIISREGNIGAAVSMISETTSYLSDNNRGADNELAITNDPDTKALNDMYDALKPGGCCYIEWTLRPSFRLKSIEQRLNFTGFENVSFYMPIPNPNNSVTKLWVPLNNPLVITYAYNHFYRYLNTTYIGKLYYLMIRMLQSGLLNIPWLSWLLISTSPRELIVASIANKPSETKNNKIINRKNYNDLSGHVTQILLFTEGEDIDNKAILFIFSILQPEPVFVVKIPRTIECENLLKNETKTLQALEENYAPIDGIPKILFTDDSSGLFSIGETFIRGTSLSKLINRKNYRELALKVTYWLINLAKKTKTFNDSGVKVGLTMLFELATSLGSLIDEKIIQKSSNAIHSLNSNYLVCEHRDLAPQNILIDPRGTIGVIDWEDSNVRGLPGVDLSFFLILLNFDLENTWRTGRFKDAYKNTLNPSTFAGRVYAECVTLYINEIGIDYKNIRTLRIIAFINWLYIHSNDVNQHSITNNIYFKLWEEEIFNQPSDF